MFMIRINPRYFLFIGLTMSACMVICDGKAIANQIEPATNVQKPDAVNMTCNNIFMQIKAEQKLPENYFTEFNTYFGKPTVDKITEYLFQFNKQNFYYRTKDSKPLVFTDIPNLAKAQIQLGAIKTVLSNTLNKYTWNCTNDRYTAKITVIIDNAGKSISTMGSNCLENGCTFFFFDINQSVLQSKWGKPN